MMFGGGKRGCRAKEAVREIYEPPNGAWKNPLPDTSPISCFPNLPSLARAEKTFRFFLSQPKCPAVYYYLGKKMGKKRFFAGRTST